MGGKRILVTRAALAENEGAAWNAFIELIASTDSCDLASSQLPAQQAFFYELEVQNGGHLQFFANLGSECAREAVSSLRLIGADAQARILEEASADWQAVPRSAPTNAETYVDEALMAEFEGADRRFHECRPSLLAILQRYFSAHEDQFILRES